MSSSKEISKALLETKAVNFLQPGETITFTSGIRSPMYIDNRRITGFSKKWKKVVHGFMQAIIDNKINFDVIAGIELAGVTHSSALAYELEKPLAIVRKEPKVHGTKSQIDGASVEGQEVLEIEDHISSGGSSLKAARVVREFGGLVSVCLAITTYDWEESKEAFAQENVQLITLTTLSEILTVAQELEAITPAQLAQVLEWKEDPREWTKNNPSS